MSYGVALRRLRKAVASVAANGGVVTRSLMLDVFGDGVAVGVATHSAGAGSANPGRSQAPGRTEGVRKITKRFGVDPRTVQRISRPFDGASEAA